MQRLVEVFIVTLIVLAPASAQVQNGRIEGVVVDSLFGRPIAGAEVTIYNETNSSRRTRSDSIGRFVFENMRPATYRIYPSHDLFLRDERKGEFVVTLKTGMVMNNVRVELEPASTVTGAVRDDNLQPQPGVRVELLPTTYLYGRRLRTQDARLVATTDDNGLYRMTGVFAGEYLVRAFPGQPSWARATYYPLMADPAKSIPVVVGPNAEVAGIDIRLDSNIRTYPVRLKLAGTPQEPTAGRSVRLNILPGGEIFENVRVETEWLSDDELRLARLPAGTFDLRLVIDPGSGRAPLNGVLRADIRDTSDPEVDLGVMTLRESVAVTARIQVPSGWVAPRGFSWNSVIVGASPIEGPYAFGASSVARVVDSGQGKTASFFVAPFGRYAVRMDLVPGVFLTEVRYAGRDVLGSGFVLDGEPEGLLDFVMGGPESVGRVTGVVRNNKFDPIARTKVVLVPEAARRASRLLYHDASTDASGVFVMDNVLPGEYTLFAWKEVDRNAWLDEDFMREQERLGVRITVRPQILTSQDLQVIDSH